MTIGLFFGGLVRRNQRIKLTDLHPVADYGHGSCCTGDAGKDGFSIISRAEADRQGHPSAPAGQEGPVYWSGQDWEQ